MIYRKTKRLSRWIRPSLVTPALIFIVYSCQNRSDTLFLLPDPDSDDSYSISYAKIDLIESGSRPAHFASFVDPKTISATDTAYPGRPELIKSDRKLCLFSHPPFYYKYEMGFVFHYCKTMSDQEILDATETLQRILFDTGQTSYPRFQSSSVSFYVETESVFKKRFVSVRAVYTGLMESFLPSDLDLTPGLHFTSKSYHTTPNFDARIFRSFPEAGYQLYITEDVAYIVYPLRENRAKGLILEIRDKNFANHLYESVLKAKEMSDQFIAEAIQASSPDAVHVSEFSGASAAGDEYIEFASRETTKPSIIHFSLRTDSDSRESRYLFLFPGATALMDRRGFPDFRMKESFEISINQRDTTVYDPDSLLSSTWSEKRSLLKQDGSWSLSRLCLTGPICGARGIHPDQESEALQRKDQSSENTCSISSIENAEYNPSGIASPEKTYMDASGKFLEIGLNEPCSPLNLVFLSGNTILDPVSQTKDETELLLFVAGTNYFSNPDSIYDNAYRSLNIRDSLKVLDLKTGEQATLFDSDPARFYFTGTGNKTSSPFYRKVYSLVADFQMGTAAFHPAFADGLRPDLLDDHALSPGLANRLGAFQPFFRLTEVSPAGSRTNSYEPVSGDEYFEIYFQFDQAKEISIPRDASPYPPSFVSGELSVQRVRDGNTKTFRFPPPLISGYVAFFREPPVCWQKKDSSIPFSDLSLPNEAATYQIHDRLFSLSDHLFDRLDDIKRSSIEDISEPGDDPFWVVSSSANAADLCDEWTRGSPGRRGRFEPALQILEHNGSRIQARIFSPTGSVLLESSLYQSGTDSDPFVSKTVESFTSEVLSYPEDPDAISTGRKIALFRDAATGLLLNATELFFGGQKLRVDAVAPTPPSGGHEWVRICSPSGFDLAQHPGETFLISDTYSSDAIVPYLDRFESLPAALVSLNGNRTSLNSDECALLIDPDSAGEFIVPIPMDRAVWTVASSSTIGNGLSSGEGFLLYLESSSGDKEPLASYGGFDLPENFSIPTSGGSFVRRRPGTFLDGVDSYEVVK